MRMTLWGYLLVGVGILFMGFLVCLTLYFPQKEKTFPNSLPFAVRQLTYSKGNERSLSKSSQNVFENRLQVDTPKVTTERPLSPWEEFHKDLTLDELYSERAPYMSRLLHSLATAPISRVHVFSPGTQFKFLIKFENGNFAIAKPMRLKRDAYWGYNKTHLSWKDPERHTAEIAAFHLDRILGFRRVAPCVGRKVDLLNEFLLKSQDDGLLDTLEWRGDDICFVGDCPAVFCNKDRIICAENGTLEISVCQKLRWKNGRSPFHEEANPWDHYVVHNGLNWRKKNVCIDILKMPKISHGRFFLDVMEMTMFDYLIRNYDRHHYSLMRAINYTLSFVVLVDNGKGFGNPFEDDRKCMAAIYQCCRFRKSTFERMLDLTKEGNKLGDLMRKSLLEDPVAPILTEEFFPALDRRLAHFIQEIHKCIDIHGQDTVLVEKYVKVVES